MTSYYDVLGVSADATPDQIKQAYRKLASVHHPDRGGDTAKFQEIQEAYATLTDPEKRRQYDTGGADQIHSAHTAEDLFRHFGFAGFDDIFRQMHQQAQPRRNRDLKILVPIELTETLRDTEKTISVKTTQNTRETVVVKIPRGISSGARIRYPGLGDNFVASLPRGDLYIEIVVQPHDKFQVQGRDLEMLVGIDCFDAILGCERQIVNLEGKTLSIKIPPGTQHNTVLALRGQGLYEINSDDRGTLRVRIQVEIPRQLSEDQLELISKIKQGSVS